MTPLGKIFAARKILISKLVHFWISLPNVSDVLLILFSKKKIVQACLSRKEDGQAI